MVNDKAYIKEEIDELVGNIKALTKLIIEKYDPLDIYDDEIMAVCTTQCRALRKLRSRVQVDDGHDYQALMEDLLRQTWTTFAAIVGVSPDFIEDQYFDYVDSITTE